MVFIGISVAVLVVLSIVGLTVFLIMHKKTKEDPVSMYVEHLVSILNTSINPCDDFYGFTCRKRKTKHPRNSVYDMTRKTYNDFMKYLNGSTNNTKLEKLHNIARTFITKCIEAQKPTNDSLEPLFRYMNSDLGVYDILMKGGMQQITMKQFADDMEKLMILPPFDFLFSISVRLDHPNWSRNVLQVSPPHCKKSKNEESEEFEELHSSGMKMMQLLNGTQFYRNIDVEIIADMCQELEVEDNENGAYIELQDPSLLCDELNMSKLIENIFRQSGVTLHPNQTLLVPSNHTFTDICSLVKEILSTSNDTRSFYDWIYYKTMDIHFNLNHSISSIHDKKVRDDNPKRRDQKICFQKAKKSLLKEVLSTLYTHEYYENISRKQISSFIDAIQRTFQKVLLENTWMPYNLRIKLKELINQTKSFVRSPDDPPSITSLVENYGFINASSNYFVNVIQLLQMREKEIHQKLHGGPIVPTLSAAEVNAIYALPINMFFILPAILREGAYHKDYPDFMNYGGIGAIIGHELGHALQSEAQLLGSDGQWRPMWETVEEEFERITACFVDQYSQYTVQNGSKLDGNLTFDENTADLIGIKLAHRAYVSLINPKSYATPLKGMKYTPEQLFFITFARFYCHKHPTVAETGDVHSPSKYRVLGTLSNSEEFARAFSCPKSSPMNPDKKCIFI